MSWKAAWWNLKYDKRANTRLFPKEYQIGNDPWFVLKRENVNQIIEFIDTEKFLTDIICEGGLANESLFAIIFYIYKEISDKGPSNGVISDATHITDWTRRTSSTSPYLFKHGTAADLQFIDDELKKKPYTMFIRKIASEFPDEILRKYIYGVE
jgi:hypothetical protein